MRKLIPGLLCGAAMLLAAHAHALELDADNDNHLDDAYKMYARNVTNVPTGAVVSATVQAAIDELSAAVVGITPVAEAYDATVMGGTSGDGEWHCYEVHLKMDTDGTDGIYEAWIDNVQVSNRTTLNFGTSAWGRILFGSNMSTNLTGGPYYVDYDDMAISATGRIGPLGETQHHSGGAPSGGSWSGQ